MKKATHKKALAVALAVALTLSSALATIAFAASGQLKVVVGSVSGSAGDTVSVPVTVTENPGIVQFYSDLAWDTSKLTLESIANGTVFNDPAHGNDLTKSPLSLNWDMSLATENNTSTGVIITLNFRIKADIAQGEVAVTLTPNTVQDFDLKPVENVSEPGKVAVVDPATPPTEEPTVPPTEEPTVPPTEEPTVPPTAGPTATPVPTATPKPPTPTPTPNPNYPQTGDDSPLSLYLLLLPLSVAALGVVIAKRMKKVASR
jgi:uncharacterized surface anchored protein